MAVTRRTFLRVAAAGAAVVAVPVAHTRYAEAAVAASPPGDVVGKVTVGYQGWFAAVGDGSPINGWWHWSNNWGQAPNPTIGSVVSWPDMREYTRSYQTDYAPLGNGQPARLFSHYDQQTVDTHFAWMRDYGIDTAALQRFNPTGGEGPIRDAVTAKVRTAAEATGRKFYVMYDVTSWTAMQSQIKADWTSKMSAYASSPAYARQNGKPVVCIWGFGFNDPGRPFAPAECLDVIAWFKAQGCYVIGGVPTYWREGINDSRPGFGDVYRAFHMISPWMVGRTGDLAGLDSFYANVNTPDQAECNARGIDYQPCVMPGDLSAGHRRHGDFYWRHMYNMVRVGAAGLYVSMFDEYNEGNQIAKTAESAAMQPTNFSGRALDEDGTACSSDYYLRLTGDGGRMLRGAIPLTAVRPTQPVVGGPPASSTNVAAGKSVTATTSGGGFGAANAVDGNADSYWESANAAWPQSITVDLGAAYALDRLVLKVPPAAAWGPRTQTLSVLAGSSAASLTPLVGSTAYAFDPATGNQVGIPLAAGVSARYLRLTFTANTGWPAAQLADLQAWTTVATTPDTQAPTAPGNLTSPARTATSVSLSWAASRDDRGVSDYQVRQGGAVVGTTMATSWTVTGLQPGTAYGFTVVARDAAGNVSSPSDALSVTTSPAADVVPPTAPPNLRVTGRTATAVTVAWDASTDDVAVVSYQLSRSGSSALGTTSGTSWTFESLAASTSYTLTAKAVDAAGNLSPASNVTASTLAGQPGTTNLAAGRPTTESSHTQSYGSASTVDQNAGTYWESANNAFPQWVQVDLGAGAPAVGRAVLRLPASWESRAQTFAVQGSTDGSSFSTLASSGARTFNPATGNSVAVALTSTAVRYVRVAFTGNTGWPAGQLSELEVYSA